MGQNTTQELFFGAFEDVKLETWLDKGGNFMVDLQVCFTAH